MILYKSKCTSAELWPQKRGGLIVEEIWYTVAVNIKFQFVFIPFPLCFVSVSVPFRIRFVPY